MSLAPPAPLLEARDLSYSRQDERIFGPVSFALAAGEMLLIEGDNGSGKTTLLRLLAGLLRLQEGVLRWRGQPFHAAARTGELLFLGHQLGLKQDLSARENLVAAIGLHGCRPNLSIDRSLDEIGLAGFADEPVRSLSAGQKKRVALARLQLVPGRLWLLDEPYANLDRAGIAQVNRLLSAHIAAGGATLISGHGAVNFLATPARCLRMQA